MLTPRVAGIIAIFETVKNEIARRFIKSATARAQINIGTVNQPCDREGTKRTVKSGSELCVGNASYIDTPEMNRRTIQAPTHLVHKVIVENMDPMQRDILILGFIGLLESRDLLRAIYKSAIK